MQNSQTTAPVSRIENAAPTSQIGSGQLPAKNHGLLIGFIFILGMATGASIPVAMKFFNPLSKKLEVKHEDDFKQGLLKNTASSLESIREKETSEAEGEPKALQKPQMAASESKPAQKTKSMAEESKSVQKTKSADKSKSAPKIKLAAPQVSKKANPPKKLNAKTMDSDAAKANPSSILEELPDTTSAAYPAPTGIPVPAAQAATNAAGSQADAVTSSNFPAGKTISLKSYTRDNLSKCAKFCVLRGKDTNGTAVSAVINGPEFATLLMQHQGSIQLVGKQQKIKNQSVFVVQSINLTSDI